MKLNSFVDHVQHFVGFGGPPIVMFFCPIFLFAFFQTVADNFAEIGCRASATINISTLVRNTTGRKGDVVAQWLVRRTWDQKVESSSPGRCIHVVFVGKTLNSHSASLHPCINGNQQIAWGQPGQNHGPKNAKRSLPVGIELGNDT